MNASFYAPLLGELRALGVGYGARPARIEVVATADHWEARYLAPHVMIARGWERQLDTYRNGLFYEESQAAQRRPLPRVARRRTRSPTSRCRTPRSTTRRASEARLLRIGRGRRTCAKSGARRTGACSRCSARARSHSAPRVLTGASSDSLTLYAPRAGSYTVRVHFTPYWALASGDGCVARAPGDWTELRGAQRGQLPRRHPLLARARVRAIRLAAAEHRLGFHG